MALRRIELILDDDDFDAIQKEFSLRQARRQELPEGGSNLPGAMAGEIVRDLWEYRAMWEFKILLP